VLGVCLSEFLVGLVDGAECFDPDGFTREVALRESDDVDVVQLCRDALAETVYRDVIPVVSGRRFDGL